MSLSFYPLRYHAVVQHCSVAGYVLVSIRRLKDISLQWKVGWYFAENPTVYHILGLCSELQM